MMRTLSRWFQPAPDSAVANVVRRGKSPWTDAVHLMWSIWVFTLPAIGGGRYDARWLWLTLLSYPVFLGLYSRTLLASRRRSPLYAYAMAALGIGLLPWYPSGISYFVFGCVMLRTCSGRFLMSLLQHPDYVTNQVSTGWLGDHLQEVLDPVIAPQAAEE